MKYQTFSARLLTGVLVSVAFVTLLLALPQTSLTASRSFSLAPPPNWIINEPVTQASAEQREAARNGVAYLLSDQQMRVSSNTVERYFHHAYQVVTQPGVEHVSQVEFSFDPSYQRLVIHRVQIRRGTQTINALKLKEIRVLEKEEEMEQQLFNGTLAAMLILNDVRVGDVVEYDYSVNGANPVLCGRFADVNYLAESEPVARLRYRLLWPSTRLLHHQMCELELKPVVKPLGEVTEYIWERTNAPATEMEPDGSVPTEGVPELHLSEFKDWAEVAAWAAPLYRATPPPALQRLVESWRQASAEPEGQILAAVRFVQDEIRYLGIEKGAHSHLPHSPAQVLEKRYGDCKDKALLLATALNALGFEAHPALVNSTLSERLPELLPSPFAFDHVITQVKAQGKTYWFDATASLQRGGLAQHVNPEFGHALVVSADATKLEEMPLVLPAQPLKLVKEIYTVSNDNRTATLTVETTYRSIDANAMRDHLAKKTLNDLAKERLQSYQQRDRSLTADGKLQVRDDPATNIIVITERYRIARFWHDGARNFVADRIVQELPSIKPDTQRPVHLTYPLDVEHQIEIRTPAPLSLKEDEGSVANEAWRFDYRREQAGNSLKLTHRLRTLRSSLKAAVAERLITDLESVEDFSNLRLTNQLSVAGLLPSKWLLLGTLSFALFPSLVFLTIKARRAKRHQLLRPKHKADVLPGSEPALPLALDGEEALAARLLALRCECGSDYQSSSKRWQRAGMFYDGRRLELVQLNCGACERGRDVYCELPMVQQPATVLEGTGCAD